MPRRPILFFGDPPDVPDQIAILPFRNPELSIADRVSDLLSRLTLDEKAAQMLHGSPAVERLGIPEYNWWNEGMHGVARSGVTAVLPAPVESLWGEPVAAGMAVLNGAGELTGSLEIAEWGTISTPVYLTATMSVVHLIMEDLMSAVNGS